MELLARPSFNGQALAADRFVRDVDRDGRACELDLVVLESALQWLVRTPTIVRASVNVSGRSLGVPGFAATVLDRIRAYGVEPARLGFEITESVPIGDFELAREFTRGVRSAGATVAMDDFGTGASHLELLAPPHVDWIKIDGRFTRGLQRCASSRALVRGLVALAAEVGLGTVIECVESREQWLAAHELGVDFVQGRAVSGSPVPIEGYSQHGPCAVDSVACAT